MKYKIGIVLILFLIIGGCSGKTGEDSFTIGAIMPLSGDIAFVGEEMQKGIDMGIQEINEQGGINGKKIVVIYEDDKFENIPAVNAATKLLNVNHIDAGMASMVSDAKPILPLFEEAETPLMVLWDVTDALRGYNYTFSIGFSIDKAGEKMATFAYNELGLRSIAVVSHQEEWSQTISAVFIETFTNLGGNIISHEQLSLSEKDYRTTLLKIKKSNADGIYAPLIPPVSAEFFNQKVELGIDLQVMEGDAFTPEVWALSPEGTEGVYFTNVFETTTPSAVKLKQQYMQAHGNEPISFPLVQMGYDAVIVYSKAMEHANTPQEIATQLHNTKNIEVSGPPISFDADGFASREEKIFQIQNGKEVLISG